MLVLSIIPLWSLWVLSIICDCTGSVVPLLGDPFLLKQSRRERVSGEKARLDNVRWISRKERLTKISSVINAFSISHSPVSASLSIKHRHGSKTGRRCCDCVKTKVTDGFFWMSPHASPCIHSHDFPKKLKNLALSSSNQGELAHSLTFLLFLPVEGKM